MGHLTKETLKDYLNLRLKDEILMEIDEHLAACADCASLVRQEKLLRFAWRTLTAEAHGRAYWQAQLGRALNEAAAFPENSNYKERIKEWISVWKSKAEAALGLIVEGAAGQAQIIIQGLESLARVDSKMAFSFAQTPIRGAEEGSITVEAAGPPFVNITVDSKQKTVTILLRKIETGKRPPLVVLVPDSKDKKPVLAEPKQPQGSKQFVAQFSNVPSGKYLLVFEPMKEKK